jgi:hypothetical protein
MVRHKYLLNLGKRQHTVESGESVVTSPGVYFRPDPSQPSRRTVVPSTSNKAGWELMLAVPGCFDTPPGNYYLWHRRLDNRTYPASFIQIFPTTRCYETIRSYAAKYLLRRVPAPRISSRLTELRHGSNDIP